jgi:putative endopeptidase
VRTYIIALVLTVLGGATALVYSKSLAGQRPSVQSSSSGIELDSIDRGADACTDFYQFACGGWMAQHPIPANLAGIGRGREMRERTFGVLLGILTKPGNDRERQKASDYYAACMDEASIEAKGVAALEPVVARIAAVNTRSELPALIAFLHSVAFQPAIPLRQAGYGALFDFRSRDGVDPQTASLNQGGMALPDRELYLSTDERARSLRGRFRDHVRQVFAILGASPDEADAAARAVIEIETSLAAASVGVMEQRVLDSHEMSLTQLQATTPHFNWTTYLKSAAAPMISTVDVTVSAAFLRTLDVIVSEAPISDLKRYLQWQVVHASVLMLPARFRQADLDFFKRTLKGQQELEPRSELCITETDDRLGDVLGKAFVDETLSAHSKSDMLTMVRAIKTAMSTEIETATWMSAETKTAAKAKLAAIVERIGYPNRWRNYSALRITKTDALGNLQRALAFDRAMDLNKIGRKVDPDEWPPRLTPSRGESGYRPERNEIIFPAGFLQPPFYATTRDAPVNYGAIGAVVGHEVTHGFDDVGRKLDGQGNWKDWWTEADAHAFEEKATCVVDQYSQYRVTDGTRVNGRLTLGENIADNGGVRLALLAYLAGPGAASPLIVDGFTPVQRLFLGWAQVWCVNVRPEAERLGATTDPHSPNKYRVNGPLSNMPEFQKAFSCKPDSPMVRQNACRVW